MTKLKYIHIENSYYVWSIDNMSAFIMSESAEKYGNIFANEVLNRSWKSMYVEWWLHNIGYWLTLLFIKNERIKTLNERFKHLDLEEHR